MNTNLIKKSITSAILFGFIFTVGGSAHSAVTTQNDSDQMMLAAGGKLGLNGKAKGVPRAPVPKVKAPKLADNGVGEVMLAKNNPPPAPTNAPVIDAPIKKAPHPPGAIHGMNDVSTGVMLAKNNPPKNAPPVIDAPIKKAPHPPGAIHGMNDVSTGVMLAKNNPPKNAPPVIDAPIKKAPHPPGAIHGMNDVSTGVMLAKNNPPKNAPPVVDAPIKKAPHPPGAIHG